MLKVGLTGGIGSGKTIVAKVFECLGLPVYYADASAKRLMNEEPLKSKISESFGADAYINGVLNRGWLAQKVFSDKEQLELLNSMVHPVTIADAERWFSEQHAPYAIKEAALIFEAGSEKKLDHVIGVYAPDETRIKRTMERDGISREHVLARMSKQFPQEKNMERCDFVIMNDDIQAILPQVLDIDKLLRARS